MLRKESAIAVMVAIMLGAASLLGGLTMQPVLATHDPDAIEIASETITQGDNESTIIDALELTLKKSTSRATGTVTIEVIQDEEVLRSATLKTSSLGTTFTDIEAQVTNLNVTGSFEILVEYEGTGVVTVTGIDVVEGTEAAEEEPPANDDGDDNGPENPPDAPDQELENVIASKTMALASDETLTIDTVEFSAKKSTSRASGTLTVAIVQDDEVLETEKISTNALSTTLDDMEASFDDLEVTDDFQVVFMYDGSGMITVRNVDVPGATEPAEQNPPTTPPNPDGTFQLVVDAVDQSGNKLTGLWVALLNGQNELVKKGFTEIDATFTLDAGKHYMVEMGDFYDEETDTSYKFEEWLDSANDDRRRSADLTDDDTFNALYTVTTGSGPPSSPPPPTTGGSPPPSSAPGTITAYAYRIPHEEWGTSTFVGANAQMYFVLYDSVGEIVYTAFFDENGHTITGLNEGETYWISPTDCHHCHGGTHDVRFHHWDDSSTERQRPVTTGMSAGAYYEYVPDTP